MLKVLIAVKLITSFHIIWISESQMTNLQIGLGLAHAVVCHIFPIWRVQGGKGVATVLEGCWVFKPIVAVCSVGVLSYLFCI
jgi:glycerol-3-phosphate acyltransferase PlsY